MIDSKFLQIPQAHKQFIDIMLDFLNGKSIEKGNKRLKFEIFQDDMCDIMMDKQVDQLRQVLSILN